MALDVASQAKLATSDGKEAGEEQLTVKLDDVEDSNDEDSDDSDRQGSWIRRRRLDGALNRVPLGFYSKIWKVLERCQAIQMQKNNRLEFALTQEVTI